MSENQYVYIIVGDLVKVSGGAVGLVTAIVKHEKSPIRVSFFTGETVKYSISAVEVVSSYHPENS